MDTIGIHMPTGSLRLHSTSHESDGLNSIDQSQEFLVDLAALGLSVPSLVPLRVPIRADPFYRSLFAINPHVLLPLRSCFDHDTPPSAVFPVEIFERIIDFTSHLSDFDQRIGTLKACAWTCRAWRPRSRYYLLQHVMLRNWDSAQDFISSLRTGHILRNHVHTLQFESNELNSGAILLRLVGLLDGLHQLRIVASPLCLPPMLFHKLHKLRTYSHPTTLILVIDLSSGFRDHLKLISSFPSLSHLELLTFGEPNINTRRSDTRRSNTKDSSPLRPFCLTRRSLTALRVYAPYGTFMDYCAACLLKSPCMGMSLQKLSFAIHPNTPREVLEAMNLLLTSSGSSLRELTIGFTTRSRKGFLSEENLNPNVQYLTLGSGVNISRVHFILARPIQLDSVMQLLNTMNPEAIRLEEISLYVQGHPANYEESWKTFDSSLSTRKFLRPLQIVNIIMTTHSPLTRYVHHLCPITGARYLPSLDRSGLVNMEAEVPLREWYARFGWSALGGRQFWDISEEQREESTNGEDDINIELPSDSDDSLKSSPRYQRRHSIQVRIPRRVSNSSTSASCESLSHADGGTESEEERSEVDPTSDDSWGSSPRYHRGHSTRARTPPNSPTPASYGFLSRADGETESEEERSEGSMSSINVEAPSDSDDYLL